MDRATAEKLMAIYAKIGAALNEADPLLRGLPEAERSAHLRAVGGVMADLWHDLQWPIVREYPELDPDKEYFDAKRAAETSPAAPKAD
jgi:hypothetical protein